MTNVSLALTLHDRMSSLDRVLCAFAMVFFLLLGPSAKAQSVSAYTFAQTSGTYTTITGGTVLDNGNFDDGVFTVALPATFPFGGAFQSTMYVSTNGFLTFGTDPADNEYSPISSSDSYSGAISPFGTNLEDADGGTREVRWQQVGSEIIVQWRDVKRNAGSNSESFSFQARLNTSTGAIVFVYSAVSGQTSSTSSQPQVGLRGANNTFATNVNNRTVTTATSGAGSSWANTAVGSANNTTTRFTSTSPSRAPSAGQTYTWTPPCNQVSSANAGSDQTICATTPSVTLGANAPTVGTGSWSVVTGSPSTSNAQFNNTASPTATFTPAGGAGNYTLRWTISNAPCPSRTDDVVITVSASPTTANAGSDQTACSNPGTATLAGNAAAVGTDSWSFISGPVTPTFGSSGSPTSSVSGMTTAGVYVFQWNIANSVCATSTDQMTITVNPTPTASNAGPDQTICATTPSVTLAANAPSVGSGIWSVVTGSPSTSNAQFNNTASPTATFSPAGGAGTYTLRWTISNSPCTVSANDVVITVSPSPTTANAGSDQTVCGNPGTATLAGNAAAVGTDSWSFISGPVTPSFGSSGSPTSSVSGMTTAGVYVFQWNIANSVCATSTDQMTITVNPTPTTSNAGPDQTICLSSGSTPLAANTPVNGTGIWSILAGSPNTSTAQLNSTTSASATFTPTTSGTYTLRWTISNSPCTASTNDVVITVNPFALPVTQTFNSNGSFVVPPGVTQITVQAWGGGGAGGGSTNAGTLQARGGAGGGGGAYVSKLLTVTPGSNLNVSVGTSVSGTSGASGSNGNASTIIGFQSLVFAAAGSGGAGNTAGGTPAGGAGGTIAASQGDTKIAGTSGGNGTTGFSYTSGAGGAGANGGGTGGAAISGFGTTSAGATGNAPGGAGSGGLTYNTGGNTAGGTGAAGRVIITYTPVASISATATTLCGGSSTTLTATGGGTYLWSPGGATTPSITVNPSITTTYTVTITNICPTVLSQQIIVNPLPAISCGSYGPVCADAADIALSGSPSGGTWSGTGVTGNNFDPSVGTQTVTYNYTDGNGCSNSCSTTITVNPMPVVSCGSGYGPFCTQDSAVALNGLPANGTWIGDGVVGSSFDPSIAESGLNVLTYTYTDINGCTSASQVTVSVGMDSDGDAIMDCVDGCPYDAMKTSPGTCGCGVVDQDADGDATMDCLDLCPNDPNKIAPGSCGCGMKEPGSTCDDGNVNTGNDLVNMNCVCEGQPLDCLGIAGGTTVAGTPCDDGDLNTINDAYQTNCTCAGTYTSCLLNQMVLEISTNNSTAHTSWAILVNGEAIPMFNGNDLAPNSNNLIDLCLPNGCYELVVTDPDGMCSQGVGGFVLRMASGERIIDNSVDAYFTGVSRAAQGFCLPLGDDHLTQSRCDLVNLQPADWIQAVPDAAVSAQYGIANANNGYQFWIYNPNGGYSRRVLITHAFNNYWFPAGAARASYLKLNSFTTNPIPQNVMLNVRVRTQVNGVYGEFGPACRISLSCPTTQLAAASCGLTNVALNGTTTLSAVAVAGATNYKWQFTAPGFVRNIATTGHTLNLAPWATNPLSNGTTYDVKVQVSFDGGVSYCAFGSTCTLSTAGTPGTLNATAQDEQSALQLWPNPNHTQRLAMELNGLGEGAHTAVVDITDLFGKQVSTQQIAFDGEEFNVVMDLEGRMAAGLYNVRLSISEHVWIQRLVVE